jgi:hypothetical protein
MPVGALPPARNGEPERGERVPVVGSTEKAEMVLSALFATYKNAPVGSNRESKWMLPGWNCWRSLLRIPECSSRGRRRKACHPSGRSCDRRANLRAVSQWAVFEIRRRRIKPGKGTSATPEDYLKTGELVSDCHPRDAAARAVCRKGDMEPFPLYESARNQQASGAATPKQRMAAQ